MSTFSERLRSRREALALTQVELARIIDRPQQRLSGWENGTTEPRLETIILLAKALNVSADWLLGLSDIETPSWNEVGVG